MAGLIDTYIAELRRELDFDPALARRLASEVEDHLREAAEAGHGRNSFDTTAAWLGPRKWRLLHLAGSWYIWVSFAVAVGKRIPLGPAYWAMFALIMFAAALRVIAMLGRSRRAAQAPA